MSLGDLLFHIAALRIDHFGSRATVHCQTHLLHNRPMSRYAREYGRTSSWYNKECAPPTNKQQSARNSCSGWSKRSTRGNPADYEGRYNQWDEGKSHDSAKDNKGEATERRDKSQGCDGTEDVEGVAQASKASDSAPADATDAETIRSKLWELQRLLNNRKGSPSATYKKHAEASTRAVDLNLKTMQALDTFWKRKMRSLTRP